MAIFRHLAHALRHAFRIDETTSHLLVFNVPLWLYAFPAVALGVLVW